VKYPKYHILHDVTTGIMVLQAVTGIIYRFVGYTRECYPGTPNRLVGYTRDCYLGTPTRLYSKLYPGLFPGYPKVHTWYNTKHTFETFYYNSTRIQTKLS
ncbi:unnamed protein product, partial [Laminaria digitata]